MIKSPVPGNTGSSVASPSLPEALSPLLIQFAFWQPPYTSHCEKFLYSTPSWGPHQSTHLCPAGGIAHGPRGPTSYYYMLPMKVRVQGLKVALTVKLAQVRA